MTIVSISQPAYLPWLGFFKKILYSDKFVFLDDVKFERGFNRNIVRVPNGSTTLTVPLKSKQGILLNEKKIDNSTMWDKKHFDSIKFAYLKTDYYKRYEKKIIEIYDQQYQNLIDINLKTIEFIMNSFNIKRTTIFSSEFQTKKKWF